MASRAAPDASDVHVVSSLAGVHGVDALRDSIMGCVRDVTRPASRACTPRCRGSTCACTLSRGGGTAAAAPCCTRASCSHSHGAAGRGRAACVPRRCRVHRDGLQRAPLC